jgi:hypothetical protein
VKFLVFVENCLTKDVQTKEIKKLKLISATLRKLNFGIKLLPGSCCMSRADGAAGRY